MRTFLFIAILFITPACFAQQPIVIFINKHGQKTSTKDSALLIRTITEAKQGSGLYNFTESFVTGEPFRTGKTLKANDILLDGECTVYYPSGKKLSEVIYENGLEKTGTYYFTNGTIFKVSKFTQNIPDPARPATHYTQESIITCNDSTGKVLIAKGNGHFIGYIPVIAIKFMTNATASIYDNWLYNNFEEGEMRNGIKDGVWAGKMGGIQYIETYKKGQFISGESDKDGNHYHYESSIEKPAAFPGGIQAFYRYLALNIQYPAAANNTQDKVVYASFIVDTDGSLTNIRIIKSSNDALSAEAIRVLKQSPLWVPGNQRGVPLRQPFNVPVSFAKR